MNFNPMKNQTKTFTKKTELVFTTIEIEKKHNYLRIPFYVATFKSGNSKNNLETKKAVEWNIEELLVELSKELGEIDERHYIIK